jgi:uncharacterized protein YjbJ (UPF0337 family)
MNASDNKESWNEQKNKLKERFVSLTDNDPLNEESKREEIISKLHLLLGRSKEELRKIFAAL